MVNFDPTGYLSMAGFEATKTASIIGCIIVGAELLKPVLMPALQHLQIQGQQLITEGLNELKQEKEVYAHGIQSAVQTNKNPRGTNVSEPIDIDNIPHSGHVFTPEN